MCMKYVNTTATCYKSVVVENNAIVAFNAPFDAIKASSENDTLYIDDFSIVTQIDFLGTNTNEHKIENPLEQNKVVDFIVRLTKCNKDDDKRIGSDLDKFSVDLGEMREKNLVTTACFDFLNYTRVTNVNRLELPGGPGRYVLKVLIKMSEDEEYTIQSMTSLNVL